MMNEFPTPPFTAPNYAGSKPSDKTPDRVRSSQNGRMSSPSARNEHAADETQYAIGPAPLPAEQSPGVVESFRQELQTPPYRARAVSFASALKEELKNYKAVVKADSWKVTVIKGTSCYLAPPKGKHVHAALSIISYHGGDVENRHTAAGAIYYHLNKRMHSNEWLAVTKALTIFHTVFRLGDEHFVNYVANNKRSNFNIDFRSKTRDGLSYAPFIKTYAAYLEQWLTMRAVINFPAWLTLGNDPTILDYFAQCSLETFMSGIPVLMETISVLLDCKLVAEQTFAAVARPAFLMILADFWIFVTALQKGFQRLVHTFSSLEVSVAVHALDMYKRYVQFSSRSQPYVQNAISVPVTWCAVPLKLDLVPLDLEESMIEHIYSPPADVKNEQLF